LILIKNFNIGSLYHFVIDYKIAKTPFLIVNCEKNCVRTFNILDVQVFDVIWHRIDLFFRVKTCNSLIFHVIYFLVPKIIFIFKSTIYKKLEHQVRQLPKI